MTSTSILNLSAEELLGQLGAGVKAVMPGPSAPIVREVFGPLPVRMPAGTVPVKQEDALRALRRGAGAQVIHRFGRKVYLKVP